MARWSSGSKGRGLSPLTLALLVGWIMVIVVGAGTRPDDAPLLGVQHGGTIIAIVMILLALLGLAILIFLRPPDSDKLPPDKRRQPWLFLGLIVLLFWLWQPDFLANQETREEDAIGGTDQAGPLDLESEPAADSVAQFSDLLLIALAVGVLGGIVYWARYRAEEVAPLVLRSADEELHADLLVALDDASAELELSNDPRSSVMNAYLSLERVLASHDRARALSETPTEHVRRAVASLGIDSAPLAQLGELYALARFSEEPITARQRDQARVALDQTRNELAART